MDGNENGEYVVVLMMERVAIGGVGSTELRMTCINSRIVTRNNNGKRATGEYFIFFVQNV